MDRGRRERPYMVQHVVGCLLVAKIGELRSMADLLDFGRRVRTAMDGIPGSIVVCGDYRALHTISVEVADGLLDLLRDTNTKLRRSALLLPTNAATVRLQMDRLMRDAAHPERRICADVAEVKAWLSSHLDATERMRLDDFLGQPGR